MQDGEGLRGERIWNIDDGFVPSNIAWVNKKTYIGVCTLLRLLLRRKIKIHVSTLGAKNKLIHFPKLRQKTWRVHYNRRLQQIAAVRDTAASQVRTPPRQTKVTPVRQ